MTRGEKAGRFEQLAKELLRRSFVAVALYQDIDDLTVCIHGPPEVERLTLDSDYNHTTPEIPLISRLGVAATNLVRISLSKFPTPLPNDLVNHLNAPIEHHFLNIPKA